MIFPPLRISQLTRDVEARRAAFDESSGDLKRAVRHKLSPINILLEHPQLWMGAAVSLLGAGGLGKAAGKLFNGNGGHAKNGHKAEHGLLAGILRFGGRTVVNTVAPLAINAVKFSLKSAFRTFRARRSRRSRTDES